ncbi:TRP-interacting helix InaF motif, partial [Trinorchestia longiramus]
MYVANDAPNSNAVHHKNSADTDSKDSSDSNKEAVVTTNDTNAYGCDSDTVLTIPTTKRKKADVTRFYRYEVKKHKKMVRILTVVAYVICVSMAAIVLSLYYVFLWDPHMTKYRDVKMSSSECDELIRKVKSDADLLNMATTDIRHRVEQLKEDAEHLVQCAINAKNN